MKQGVLEGVRVVEPATGMFVPSAGAVLANWGADVIKIERAETGDPQRGLISFGVVMGTGSVNQFIEHPNRGGKRGLGLDIGSDSGHEVLRKLVDQADVFVTKSATRLALTDRLVVARLVACSAAERSASSPTAGMPSTSASEDRLVPGPAP